MKTLNILVDVSGSMREMGKLHLQKNLCRYATQLQLLDRDKYSDLDIHFYQWTQNVTEINLQNGGNLSGLFAQGSSSLMAFSDFILKYLNDSPKLRILILSDGNFDRNDYNSFLKWKEDQDNLLLRTVAIGADADLRKLKKISTNNNVYLSENITSAIDCTIFGTDKHIDSPESIADIRRPEKLEQEEDWDA